MKTDLMTLEHPYCVRGNVEILSASGEVPIHDSLNAATDFLEAVVHGLRDLMKYPDVSNLATLTFYAAETALALVYSAHASVDPSVGGVMTNPITSVNDVAAQVADEAIDQLEAAVQTIIQLEALFRACRKELGDNSDTARLIALGEYTAMDQGNGFDCTRETLRARLNNCAPHFAMAENVARESGGDQ